MVVFWIKSDISLKSPVRNWKMSMLGQIIFQHRTVDKLSSEAIVS